MDHPSLTEAEFKIMALLWDHAPRTITELTRILAPDTGWTKHTVISLLRRMVQKGSVRMAESGRAKQFYPLIEKAGMAKDQAKSLLDRLFDGKAALLMHTMVEMGGLTDEDLAELSAFIESKRGEG
jgi:predicted transcriptional regulator